MKRFSQRKGFKPVSETIQVNGISEELINSLWNVLDVFLFKTDGFLYVQYGKPKIDGFSSSLWFHFFKKPVDTIPEFSHHKLEAIRKFYFSCEWYEVYDFIEYVLSYAPHLTKPFNAVLEKELSGYRIISGKIVDITHEKEVEMLEEALRDTRYEGVNAHLQRSLELLSDRKNPDYRNSIKESISAVESMAKVITNDPKATLGDALRALEKSGKLHPALQRGFSNLYGYTSDEDGVRHAMLEEPNISASDAKFFLLSCTSFVNYLKSKMV
jgi:hypothetical protein